MRLLACLLITATLGCNPQEPVKVLLVEGQSIYHGNWPEVGDKLVEIIGTHEAFEITRVTTAPINTDISDFAPNFGDYDVVISTYDGAPWPETTMQAFEKYIAAGGGLVSIHAADNAFPEWPQYNQMIGLGGWGGRDSRAGPYVYYDDSGKRITDDSPGRGGYHGEAHEFEIQLRESHPVTEGLSTSFMHVKDELYEQLRGPALNMTVLATAYASPQFGGSDRHEPVLMAIEYGEGRVFHSVLGHDVSAISGEAFIVTLLRGCEWAGTGKIHHTKELKI